MDGSFFSLLFVEIFNEEITFLSISTVTYNVNFAGENEYNSELCQSLTSS